MADQNIALNKPVTASSYVKPYEPARAVNGTYGATTPTSRWLCNTVPAAMVVDLGSVNVITAWTVRHMGVAGWASPDYNMVDYSLQGSNNNSSWVTIDSVTNNTLSTTTRSVTSAYRYVRLYVTKGLRTNTQFASIMELEVYGHLPNATLSALTISNGALTPVFAPTTLAYTAPNVPYGTTSVAITATAADPTSIIKINGTAVTSGQSSTVNLNVGSNTINVLVTAIDGMTTKTYTITVIREQGAILTDLTISSGTLNPTFSSSNLSYTTQNVAYDTASVTVTPTTTVAGTTITVAGNPATSGQPSTVNLNVGSNTINVVATNGTASQTYTITVVRASSPYLQSVTGIPGITFVKTTYTYTINNFSGSKIKPVIVPEDANSTITLTMNNVPVPYTPPITITLNSGANVFVITDTSATGGDSRSYTFNINK